MILPGLVSVTFRQLQPQEIIDLVLKAGLKGIEWGGDVHVPHGDTRTASRVAQLTLDAGLDIAAYGSYYRFDEEQLPFEQVLETAEALKAPLIRVWAGKKGSAKTSEAEWQVIIEQSRKIADKAEQVGIKLAYEYHGGTLTDTNESALRLLSEVNHPNFYSLWQPLCTHDQETRLKGLEEIKPWLTNLHVYFWQNGGERFPLAEGDSLWREYLTHIQNLSSKHYCLLEFVKDDQPQQLIEDALYFKDLLAQLNCL